GPDAGHALDRPAARFQPRHVGIEDFLVTLQAEDQRDVDVAALADHLADGGYAGGGGRDLHHEVGAVDRLVQPAGGGNGGGGVVGDVGGDLHADEAVTAAG